MVNRSFGLMRIINTGKEGIEEIWKNRGRAQEDVYINRKDSENLLKLMAKLDSGISSENYTPEMIKKHREELLYIMRRNNMRLSDGMIDDLLSWKRFSD